MISGKIKLQENKSVNHDLGDESGPVCCCRERKGEQPNVSGTCACIYSVCAIIRDASISFVRNVHSRMCINLSCKGAASWQSCRQSQQHEMWKKNPETRVNAVSHAFKNSVNSFKNTYRWEVETYRGNIVFALSRPAQPKQLLQWTLGRTLLGGMCVGPQT